MHYLRTKGKSGLYRSVIPETIKVDLRPGNIFYAPRESNEFTSKREEVEPRKYKALETYEHFMLCESLNGMKHHKRCFKWVELQNVKIL